MSEHEEPSRVRVTLDYLEDLSARSDDGRLRDAIAFVRSAVWDDADGAEQEAAPVVRVDRYTIEVDGHRVRATLDQEQRIAAMTAEQRARFATVMRG